MHWNSDMEADEITTNDKTCVEIPTAYRGSYEIIPRKDLKSDGGHA